MPTHAMDRLRAASMLAPIVLFLAAGTPATAASQIQAGVSGVHYGSPAVPALACQGGSAGSWLEANGAAVEGGDTRRMSLTFGAPLATDTYHVAMNEAGWRDLALVEFQAEDGVWHKVWEGQQPALAPGFSQQPCFEQKLAQKQVMQALRFTFRSAQDDIEVNHAALLRR